jgi:hypothetical protein
MAPVLQCPDCGTKHPLSAVPTDAGTFPCHGCGRTLKVPEFVPRTARSSAPVAAPAAPPPTADPKAATAPATRAMPVAERSAERPRVVPPPVLDRGTAFGPVPLWMRFLLWIIAVPLGFLIVFVLARAIGLFTSEQLSDVFLANNAGRFWPVIRLLPFVAFVTAALVHAGVYAIARRRGRRRAL